MRFWTFRFKKTSGRGFEESTRPATALRQQQESVFVVRNRVGGPVVNETEHKTINWNSDDQIHVLVLYKELVMFPCMVHLASIVCHQSLVVCPFSSRKWLLEVLWGSFPVAHSQETLQTRSRTPNQTLLSNIANMRFCIISPGNSINTNI